MTQSYRRSGDETPQDQPYAYGTEHGDGYGGVAGGAPGFPPPPPYAPTPSRRRAFGRSR